MRDLSLVMVGVFVAASLPFLISILASLSPSLSSHTAEEYFLSNRQLSISGFIASTIGYSLQVSSIFLFFYWGIEYGLYPLIMCVTWAVGYAILGLLVKSKKLDNFLGLTDNQLAFADAKHPTTATIHGYVGGRMMSRSVRGEAHASFGNLSIRSAVLVISLASVIGIAGTMMTEIDYSAAFVLQGIGLEHSDSLVRYSTQISILLFTTLYVLWGGFKAAVFTDRFQVPVAYVGLGVFTVGICLYARDSGGGIGVFYLLLILLLLYGSLLLIRLGALSRSDDPWSRPIAYLTFGSLFLVTLVTTVYYSWPKGEQSFERFQTLLHPQFPSQFVIWGGLAFLVTNLVWQLIDISGLQRLQAIDKRDIQKSRVEIANVIIKTGLEAGLGWALIIVGAFTLKLVGVDSPTKLIPKLLEVPGWVPYLIPIFVLTVVVFMLSTISGFISAVAYIAHFDIAPSLRLYDPAAAARTGDEIRITRLVTLVCVILIYLGYTVLRTVVQDDKISTLLYAIWAFQLAITPTVLAALLTRFTLFPLVVVVSTLTGLFTAWYVATHPSSTLFGIPINEEAWSMLPPLAVVLASSIVFVIGSWFAQRCVREQVG
jgi:hypothetical protein